MTSDMQKSEEQGLGAGGKGLGAREERAWSSRGTDETESLILVGAEGCAVGRV